MSLRYNEDGTGTLSGTLRDENGDVVIGSELASLTLTLLDTESLEILNERNEDDILSPNPVSELGAFLYQLQDEDNVIVTERRQVERHRAVVTFTTANAKGRELVNYEVRNLPKVGGSPE